RARILLAACIWHHAEGAELVASFLDRDEGRNAASADRFRSWRRQETELVRDRKFGFDDRRSSPGPLQQVRKVMVALWTHNDIDRRCASHDLGTLCLRNTPGDDDLDVASVALRDLPRLAKPSQLGINFFRSLLADVASVEDHDVGVGS